MDLSLSGSATTFADVLDSSGNWIALDNCRLQWEKIYDNCTDIGYLPEVDHISMGSRAGSIAVHKTLCLSSTDRPKIEVYDQTLTQLSTITVDHQCKDAFPYVLPDDSLCAITDDLSIFIYTDNILTKKASLPNSSLVSSFFWDDGLAVLCVDGQIYIYDGFEKISRLASIPDANGIRFFGYIPRSSPLKPSQLAVIVPSSGNVLIVGASSQHEVEFQSPIISAALSFSMSRLALLHSDFHLSIVSPLLNETYSEVYIDISLIGHFTSLRWIGDAIPVILFNGGLLVADGSNPTFNLSGIPMAFTDEDSVFILGSNESFRLCLIPESISRTLSSIPLNDGRRLCQVYDQRLVNPPMDALSKLDLRNAISDCLEASAFVSNPSSKQYLLNAAIFGAALQPDSVKTSIISIHFISLLWSKAKIPMTSAQFSSIPKENLVSRLCERRQFDLAYEIADFSGINCLQIGSRFTEFIAASPLTDEECAKEILMKPYISIGSASSIALSKGRNKLARLIADGEQSLSKKAFWFAKVEAWDEAFGIAERSCNCDTLLNILNMAISARYEPPLFRMPITASISAHFSGLFPKGALKSVFRSMNKDSPSYYEALRYLLIDGEICIIDGLPSKKRINDLQCEIAENFRDKSIIGLSVNETIRQLCAKGMKNAMKMFASECKVKPDKLAILRIQSLARMRRWNKMRDYGSSKKRRSLWEYCLEMYLSAGEVEEARKFLTDIEVVDEEAKRGLQAKLDSGVFGPNALSDEPSFFRCFS